MIPRIESRRSFLVSLARMGWAPVWIGTLGCRTPRIPGRRTAERRAFRVPDAYQQLFRPLKRNAPLARDAEAIAMLRRWFLKTIRLANRYHAIPLDETRIGQISNLRRDTNAYMLKTVDTAAVARVLESARDVSWEIQTALPRNERVEIAFANFFWIRQIRSADLKKGDRTPGRPNSHVAQETYWLDIWLKKEQMLIPAVRVYHDSAEMIRPLQLTPDATEPEMARGPSEEAHFSDFDRVVMTWHEFAEALNLTRNVFYVRACMHMAAYPDAVLGTESDATAPYSWLGVIYKPQGFPAGFPAFLASRYLTIDTSVRLIDNVQRWALSSDEKTQIGSNVTNLLDFLDVRFFKRMRKDEYAEDIELVAPARIHLVRFLLGLDDLPSIPRRERLDDASEPAKELVYLFLQLVPLAVYMGEGLFSVPFRNTGVSAAENGVRTSPFSIVIVLETAGTPGGAGTGAAGGIASAVVNAAFDIWTEREAERKANNRFLDQYANEICAPSSSTTAQCNECVRETSVYQNEREEIGDAHNWQLAGAGAGVAAGCAVGAAVGVWFYGIGAAVGCAIGALAALIVSGAEAYKDYQDYKAQMRELDESALGPCESLPDITLGS
jgi:hypothetical protein